MSTSAIFRYIRFGLGIVSGRPRPILITDGIWKSESPDRISSVHSIERYFQTSARPAGRVIAYVRTVQSLGYGNGRDRGGSVKYKKKSPNAHAMLAALHFYLIECVRASIRSVRVTALSCRNRLPDSERNFFGLSPRKVGMFS